MLFKKISIEQALDKNYLQDIGLIYGLVYSYNSVQLTRIEDLLIDRETLIEARFFNEDSEVHIFKRDELEAVIFMETEDDLDHSFSENHLLERFGDKLIIKHYLDYDQDGQAYIRYSRPANVIFREGEYYHAR
ncbi:hypothetical protein [Tepidibacillus fermentans]|uniref:Uncharacterized protein n=1 Tax=Tepidibacillus fermentans TaxID=1281767 RepID=A0A4V2URU5_9BACI|nr:hypothetical protein [Tepidibacillus fermentans]TCS78932.1 hypothetical protein EDD72_12411 [Tepidibacillus fermentans]